MGNKEYNIITNKFDFIKTNETNKNNKVFFFFYVLICVDFLTRSYKSNVFYFAKVILADVIR
jgi:hypothetical protein